MESSTHQQPLSSTNPQPSLNPIPQHEAEEAIGNRNARREMRKAFLGFNVLYLPHYLTLPPADFHPELLSLLEDHAIKFLSIIGFRGSAKSSFASLALPLWMALEEHERYPFIIVVNETRDQAIETIANIRKELEENELLLRDYGDVSEGVSKQREWTKTAILLKNDARILELSRGQRIRGRRHRQHRPSVVIIDDPEELEKVDKKEYRDKTERWLRGNIIPAIEETSARLIMLGNILHTDAIMARIKNDTLFVHRDYAIFKGEEKWENCTWKAKYPTPEALKRQEQKVKPTAWKREYCLKIVPPEGQEVKEEWIQYYDVIPQRTLDPKTKKEVNPIIKSGVGEDLAISKQQTADFTTMVGGVLARLIITEGDDVRLEGTPKLYILPNPINERLSFHETQSKMKQQNAAIQQLYCTPIFYVEDVGYQRAAIEMAQTLGLVVIPRKVGTDKRARLRAAATFIQNGTILFPRKGCEDLLTQLLGFGIEDHDDLADGFVHLVLGLLGGETEILPEVIGLL
ncbi:MAG: hypothetical protein AB1352_03610 [Patescibacteria group bacterium]